MKKTLLLFTKAFPFHISEPFLENEYPLYKKYFDKVVVITACRKGEIPTRKVTDPVVEFIYDYTQSGDKKSVISALPALLSDKMFYRELAHLIRSRKINRRILQTMINTSLCGNHRAKMAKKWIKGHPEYDVGVIYSYWLNIPAYSAVRLRSMLHNKNLKIVSRAHGFDVYEERWNTNYIPYQEQICEELDRIASVSRAGKEYLEEKYPFVSKKTDVQHLGAIDREQRNPIEKRIPIRLISCARIEPVKRLEKIVDALSLIHDSEVHWTHFGGGTRLNELKEYASQRLPDNIHAVFKGTVPNTEIYEEYAKTPYHALISVSASEGLPVSMSEAMSFGIPVIATAVGGVPELVVHGENGLLIPKDFESMQLVNAIKQLVDMSETEYLEMRNMARRKFEMGFNAISNYNNFLKELVQLSGFEMKKEQ